MNRYGKSADDVKYFKKNLLSDNDDWMSSADKQLDLLRKQPLRTMCKICKKAVSLESRGGGIL